MNIHEEVKALVEEYAGDSEDISLEETAREIVEKVRKADKYLYEALKVLLNPIAPFTESQRRHIGEKALAKYEGRK